MTDRMFPAEALRTLATPFWKLWIVRLLGRRFRSADQDGAEVTFAHWRGKTYFLDYKRPTTAHRG